MDMPNEVLELILNWGNLEYVVSKERVSSRFQSLINYFLSQKTHFVSDTIRSLPVHVAKRLAQRIPKLKDGVFLFRQQLRNSDIEDLAESNQKIVKFHFHCNTGDHKYVYQCIRNVKQMDPTFNGDQIKCFFNQRDEGLKKSDERLP